MLFRSVRFERFLWGFATAVVGLMFLAGPLLTFVVPAAKPADPTLAAVMLVLGTATVAYVAGFFWPMLSNTVWSLLITPIATGRRENYRSAAAAWGRSALVTAALAGLLAVTGTNPLGTLTELPTAAPQITTLGQLLNVVLPAPMPADRLLANAMENAGLAVADAQGLREVVQAPNLEAAAVQVRDTATAVLYAQGAPSIRYAKHAMDHRFEQQPQPLRWVPFWAVFLLYLMGHVWFPFGLLLQGPLRLAEAARPHLTVHNARRVVEAMRQVRLPETRSKAVARTVIRRYSPNTRLVLRERGASSDRGPAPLSPEWRMCAVGHPGQEWRLITREGEA